MNSLIKTVPNVKKFNDYLFEINKGTSPIMLSGLTDVGKIHMAYSTKFYSEKPICIITYNELHDNNMIDKLEVDSKKCDGYVKLTFDNVTEYKAYIKCNKYQTHGFEGKNLDSNNK